ncbi:carnosine N-methyltransferase-like [Oppia nitens]|uniref:carnosine N-methyltransferase-like n=1 Tax=Oppia nitens TaxID=1686743 RepID=UPI0023DA07D4|nr:carnosine N-methyltransferase-like [Oppia nitens]
MMDSNGVNSDDSHSDSHTDQRQESICQKLPTVEVDEQQERQHFYHIVNCFRSYKLNGFCRVSKAYHYLNSLNDRHKQMLTTYKTHLENISKCIEHNFTIIELIIEDISSLFENIDYTTASNVTHEDNIDFKTFKRQPALDSDKVNSVFKQLVREWTDEGYNERRTCFEPILNEIEEYFNYNDDRSSVHVLVPGAGLGRLPFEIAKRGFTCQGNEYSLFMLITSNFILNKCKDKYIHTFYPWAQHFTNNVRSADQLTAVRFPDINPSDLTPNTDFSMAAGNFTEIYTEANSWDCVATTFFIDTASNVVEYIDTIWKILKPGSIWVNIGPLLWHNSAEFSDNDSLEPSYEIIREIIVEIGFEMIKEMTNVSSYYTQNPHSMLAYEYRSVFFVCKKPIS